MRPDKKIKMFWDLMIISIISLYFYLIPMQLSFDMFYDDLLEKIFEQIDIDYYLSSFIILIPEIILIIESLLKFITGFYENGIIIEDRSEIVHHYLGKGLIFDCLSYNKL